MPKRQRAIAEFSDLVKVAPYEELKGRYPAAVEEVEKKIRASRSKYAALPFEEFSWGYKEGEMPEYQDIPEGTIAYRIAAQMLPKGIFRCSSLYRVSDHTLFPGNWSF